VRGILSSQLKEEAGDRRACRESQRNGEKSLLCRQPRDGPTANLAIPIYDRRTNRSNGTFTTLLPRNYSRSLIGFVLVSADVLCATTTAAGRTDFRRADAVAQATRRRILCRVRWKSTLRPTGQTALPIGSTRQYLHCRGATSARFVYMTSGHKVDLVAQQVERTVGTRSRNSQIDEFRPLSGGTPAARVRPSIERLKSPAHEDLPSRMLQQRTKPLGSAFRNVPWRPELGGPFHYRGGCCG